MSKQKTPMQQAIYRKRARICEIDSKDNLTLLPTEVIERNILLREIKADKILRDTMERNRAIEFGQAVAELVIDEGIWTEERLTQLYNEKYS